MDNRLNSEVYEAFKKLVDDASLLGYHIRNNSSYGVIRARNNYMINKGLWSFLYKKNIFLSLDVLWMKDDSYKYGFILRYPKGGQELFGYGYDPWHYRYVGVDAATYIYENNITFEEYYAYFVEG